MSEGEPFSFKAAFDRNIGWLAEWEQQALRGKRVAIAGMGGVGGVHLLTLARLGIGAFHVADLDRFEVANFNRQIGATIETVGRPKAQVLAEMALAINPEIRIKRFDAGVAADNIDAFLSGADLFVDGFDFFVLEIRRKVFARCRELGIPALTAAPVGMGVGFLAFTPEGMAFEDYFRFEGQSELRQYVNFLLGIAPSAIHRNYLVDPSRMDFARRKAPSTVIGCQLCASVTAAAAVKLLLRRGVIKPAPYHHHYDAYLGKLVITRLHWGNDGPLQRLKAKKAERVFGALLQQSSPAERRSPASPLEEILDVARWAPSGDNAQPWRFRLVGNDTVVVRVRDESDSNVYEYRNGEPTFLSAGMLLESMRIAATAFARNLDWTYTGRNGSMHEITVRFQEVSGIQPDQLYAYVPLRSVDRRPYRSEALTQSDRQSLSAALGSWLALKFYSTFGARWRIARLNAKATSIRLRIKETFSIHQRIIDWKRNLSPTGIPANAVGLDPMTLKVMHWAMRDWSRTRLLNSMSGTFAPALQMDYLPGLCSAAYFTMRMPPGGSPEERIPALLKAGQSIQRFWLTATKRGLAVQPCLATLAFAHYGKTSSPFTNDASARRAANVLASSVERVLGADELVFIGRIGRPRPQTRVCRSTRRSLDELIES
jgi:nitroreductase